MIKPFYIGDTNYEYNIHESINRGISLQVHISDIHFGIIDPKVEYDILHKQFISKIKNLPLDCISIDGDLFDRLYTANTDATLYANLFFRDLYDICVSNRKNNINTVLVLLMGTKNHDSDQLRLFYPYLNDPNIDLRIVEKIKFEYINGCRVLCIPELYNVSDEEYNKYLYGSGLYDMVFMHGSIEGAVYDNKMQESKMFSPNDFGFCMGPVIAGHIHTGPSLHGYCFYNGSPIRWNFGEEETKGFQIVLYDMNNRYYYIHKEPIYSFKYDTISIDDILMSDPKDIIQYINDLREKNNIDHIRLKCISNIDTQDNINILKEYYRTDKTVKWKIVKEQDLEKENFDKRTQELYDQYSYFFNKSMSPYEILARFVNESQTDIMVTSDQIIDALRDI